MEIIWSNVVYIIIALVILAALIFIFIYYSGSFFSTTKGYSQKSNIDDQVQNCNRLVMQGARYEYCCMSREIKPDEKTKLNMTCNQFSEKNYGKDVQKMDCEEICAK